MKYIYILISILLLSGCSSTPSDEIYGLDKPYYGASEYCLDLKKRTLEDYSNSENYDQYRRECEYYGGNEPPVSDQTTDCIINAIFGGSCSEAYEKWQ